MLFRFEEFIKWAVLIRVGSQTLNFFHVYNTIYLIKPSQYES